MTSLSKKLAFTKHLPRHLSELSHLLNRNVQREELLSLEDTETVRERSKEVQRTPSWKCEIKFSEKAGARFQNLVHALEELHSSPVYVWTPLANECGLPRPVPLTAVNFEFDFTVNPEGIFTILTADLSDEMLLDYSENERDEKVLEVEVSGEHWGRAQY